MQMKRNFDGLLHLFQLKFMSFLVARTQLKLIQLDNKEISRDREEMRKERCGGREKRKKERRREKMKGITWERENRVEK